jgi:hypothetical protein
VRFSEGLTKVYEIEGAETPNDNKNFIQTIPGFDVDTNPFLVLSGRNETWLINVSNDEKKCRA